MPGARAFARELRRHVRKLVDVGADRKALRLAGQHEAGPLLRLEVVERPAERLERMSAERARLRPVLAVVDRDDREVAVAAELELGLGHLPSLVAR